MSHHLHAAAIAQADADRLIEMVAQAAERANLDPTPDNRLLQIEAVVATIVAQYRALSAAAYAQQEYITTLESRLPLESYVSFDGHPHSRIVSSGSGFVHESDIEIDLGQSMSLRIALHPEVESCVLAAREHPVTVESFISRDRHIRTVYITEVQRAGEIMVHDHFELATVDGESISYQLELSFASLGGLITSPIRVTWCLSQVLGGDNE